MKRRPKKKPSRCVYVVEAENGLCKIGSAADISSRLETLQTGSPIPLKLAYFSAPLTNAFRVEYAAQVALWEHKTAGEWFAVSRLVAEDAVIGAEERLGRRATTARPMFHGQRLDAALHWAHALANADTPEHTTGGMPEAATPATSIQR